MFTVQNVAQLTDGHHILVQPSLIFFISAASTKPENQYQIVGITTTFVDHPLALPPPYFSQNDNKR